MELRQQRSLAQMSAGEAASEVELETTEAVPEPDDEEKEAKPEVDFSTVADLFGSLSKVGSDLAVTHFLYWPLRTCY